MREAERADAPCIAEIHVRARQAAYSRLMSEAYLAGLSTEELRIFWDARLAEPTTHVLVADDDGAVRGWVELGPSRDDDTTPTTMEVYRIYVDPESWRDGVGGLLWDHAERELAAAGARTVALWVYAENHRARAFYESRGCRPDPDGVRQLVRGGRSNESLRYVKELAAGATRDP